MECISRLQVTSLRIMRAGDPAAIEFAGIISFCKKDLDVFKKGRCVFRKLQHLFKKARHLFHVGVIESSPH